MSMCKSGVNTCAFLWLVKVRLRWEFIFWQCKSSFPDCFDCHCHAKPVSGTSMSLRTHWFWQGRDGSLTLLILLDIKSVLCSAWVAEQLCCAGRVEMTLCKARSDWVKNGLCSCRAECGYMQGSSAQLCCAVVSCWAAFQICIHV